MKMKKRGKIKKLLKKKKKIKKKKMKKKKKNLLYLTKEIQLLKKGLIPNLIFLIIK